MKGKSRNDRDKLSKQPGGFVVVCKTKKAMTNPENPNLDDAREDEDPGNEFEQGEGKDTGNELLDTDEPNISALEAASRASESAYTLNFDDELPPKPDKPSDKGDGTRSETKR